APAPISGMDRPVLVPIEYRGELVALVSPQRVYIVSSRLRVRAVGDPELRFVALMCACCGEVLNGRLPGPYTSALGVAWAKRALLTDDEPSGLSSPLENGPGFSGRKWTRLGDGCERPRGLRSEAEPVGR